MTITGGGGQGAKAEAKIVDGELVGVTVTNGGSGYERLIVELTNTCADAPARAQVIPDDVIAGRVGKVTVVDSGRGYTKAPKVIISGAGGRDAKATAAIDKGGKLARVTVIEGGRNYSPLNVEFSDVGATTPAQALIEPEHVVDGRIQQVTVVRSGNGYTQAPAVTISGGCGEGAEATAEVIGGQLSAVSVTQGGRGYKPLTVNFLNLDADAAAQAQVDPEDIVDGKITKVTVVDPGKGYTKTPVVSIKNSTGASDGIRSRGLHGRGREGRPRRCDARQLGLGRRHGPAYRRTHRWRVL